MSQKLPDKESGKSVFSLNSKQRELFNVLHTWGKDYSKYNRHDVEPVKIFVSGKGGTNKSHLAKVIYKVISEI